MSTETTELTPLVPDAVPETPVEEVDAAEAPATPPEWSKPLQKMQQEQANFMKRIEGLLKTAQQAPTPQARASKLDSIMSRIKGNEGQVIAASSPELAALLSDFAEEVADLKSGSDMTQKVTALEARQQAMEAFEEFMQDKPDGFRKAYIAEQKRVQNKWSERGTDVDSKSLQVHMTEWAENYLEKLTAGKATAAPRASGTGRVIPAPGARSVSSSKPTGNPFGVKVGDKF